MCDDLVEQAEENVQDFDRFLADLEPLRDSIDANFLARTMARLRWNFRKTDLLLRSKLDSSKSTMILCMTTIHTRHTIEQLEIARRKAERDETEIRDLQSQV